MILSKILSSKLVVIIRGADTPEVFEMIEALRKGGVRQVEITLNSPNAHKSIGGAVQRFGRDMQIGAGTVLNSEEARKSIDCGAQFIISPTLNLALIETTKKLGAVSIPGGFSPTEILNAFQAGADLIKVFPSTQGPDFIRQIKGPLPQIRLMSVGGIDLDNAVDFIRSGADAVGVGGALINYSGKLNDQILVQLETNARAYVHSITNIHL